MSAYWWQCEVCNQVYGFNKMSQSRGMAHFIRDELVPSDWDQALLTRQCSKCGKTAVRITYEFPRADREVVQVLHIVGLALEELGDYLPMMWETYSKREPEPWFDFKYINGRNVLGLSRPAVFTQDNLRRLFSLYAAKAGKATFP